MTNVLNDINHSKRHKVTQVRSKWFVHQPQSFPDPNQVILLPKHPHPLGSGLLCVGLVAYFWLPMKTHIYFEITLGMYRADIDTQYRTLSWVWECVGLTYSIHIQYWHSCTFRVGWWWWWWWLWIISLTTADWRSSDTSQQISSG